jgi:hypothetical protein
MASGLRLKDSLDGAANFSPWKERISLLLKEHELWDIMHHTTIELVVIPTDPTQLD